MNPLVIAALLTSSSALVVTKQKGIPKVQAPALNLIKPLGGHVSTPTQIETLRNWLAKPGCVNLALVPQYNNQHSLWGLLQMLKDEGLLKQVTGISACSGGTLPGAFLAAGKDFSSFSKVFPKDGWSGFGPSEPKITKDYTQFLQSSLPKTFGELKIPLAISVTAWDHEASLKNGKVGEAHPLVISKGDLTKSMLAAVATGNQGAIPDPTCPKCAAGFWPKQLGQFTTVTDGAFTDIWGTIGLNELPKCDRLLHVLPLDYAGQTQPLRREKIPGQPKEIVTLVVTQPPVASHSYTLEKMQQFSKNLPKLFRAPKFTEKGSEQWLNLMYTNAKTGMAKKLDSAFDEEVDPNHHVLTIEEDHSETMSEKAYDMYMSWRRDLFWDTFQGETGEKLLGTQVFMDKAHVAEHSAPTQAPDYSKGMGGYSLSPAKQLKSFMKTFNKKYGKKK